MDLRHAFLGFGLPSKRSDAKVRAVSLRTVEATRYVAALREGGSVPAIVEADDHKTYVLKYRAAAQGAKALIAELVGGEVGRALGLPVPEIVLMNIDAQLGRTEPNPEVQLPLRASVGLNLALEFLSGALPFDPAVWKPEGTLASRIVWFDAYIANVDRTVRNTNLLLWQHSLHLIDHGASLYHQHDWATFADNAASKFAAVRQHVLLPFADSLMAVDEELASRLTPERLREIVADIPDGWLGSDGAEPAAARATYLEYLTRRVQAPRAFVQEAVNARSQLV